MTIMANPAQIQMNAPMVAAVTRSAPSQLSPFHASRKFDDARRSW